MYGFAVKEEYYIKLIERNNEFTEHKVIVNRD